MPRDSFSQSDKNYILGLMLAGNKLKNNSTVFDHLIYKSSQNQRFLSLVLLGRAHMISSRSNKHPIESVFENSV